MGKDIKLVNGLSSLADGQKMLIKGEREEERDLESLSLVGGEASSSEDVENLNSSPTANAVDFRRLVEMTDHYSGADLTNVVREAAMMGMRVQREALRKARQQSGAVKLSREELAKQFSTIEDLPVSQEDFETAIKNVCRSVGNEDLDKFSEWMKEFGATI